MYGGSKNARATWETSSWIVAACEAEREVCSYGMVDVAGGMRTPI